jgi:hypothetical protein
MNAVSRSLDSILEEMVRAATVRLEGTGCALPVA